MDNNQKDLQSLYQLVQKRYLKLKRESKFVNKDDKNPNKASLSATCIAKNSHFNTTSTRKSRTPQKNEQQKISQQQIRHFSEEYRRQYVGREKQFYQKYKNDLNAIKFLKYSLFSKLNQIDFQANISDFDKLVNIIQTTKCLTLLRKKIQGFLNQQQIIIFLLLGLIMFGYNVWSNYNEVVIEKNILNSYRGKYANESEALYQIQKEKYFLYEKLKWHKDLNIIQSLLNRKIKMNLSLIFGILFFLMSLIKSIIFHFQKSNQKQQIQPRPLFSQLALNLDQKPISQKIPIENSGQKKQFNQNQACNMNNQRISEVYEEQKTKQEEQFLEIFNKQREYILKRKEEEQIKRDVLEQKKIEMVNQLKYMNYQKEKEKESKQKRKGQTLSVGSFQFENGNKNQTQSNRQDEPINFVSNYYKYEKFHSSEDEDYDIPQFGQKKPVSHLNKFPKRSKLLVTSKFQEPQSEPVHVRSRSIDTTFKVINTKNESESYKFCERLF